MIADKAAQANLLGGRPLTASAQALIEEPPLARKLGAPFKTFASHIDSESLPWFEWYPGH
jgi:hypothetical protein